MLFHTLNPFNILVVRFSIFSKVFIFFKSTVSMPVCNIQMSFSCGRYGCGRYGLWPIWYRPIKMPAVDTVHNAIIQQTEKLSTFEVTLLLIVELGEVRFLTRTTVSHNLSQIM